ncbi:MAG: hypothetical protein LBI29_03225 [Rickettsiales bacterium]|jgi:hypothetical protein|nr:hypothetical protein [Rickettsiales bacterium]
MIAEMAIVVAVIAGLSSARDVDQTIRLGADTTAGITEEGFEKSKDDSRGENDRSLAGPKKRKNITKNKDLLL